VDSRSSAELGLKVVYVVGLERCEVRQRRRVSLGQPPGRLSEPGMAGYQRRPPQIPGARAEPARMAPRVGQRITTLLPVPGDVLPGILRATFDRRESTMIADLLAGVNAIAVNNNGSLASQRAGRLPAWS
jgi:hypothetical protein